MNFETKLYSASEFLQKLKQDDFMQKALVITGMIKTADDDAHLMFAPTADCTNWMTIPIETVESIQLLDVIACKDHTHPLVNLTMKEPTSEEGRLFAILAKSRPAASLTTKLSMPNVERSALNFQQFFKILSSGQNETLRSAGPNEWFPCWSHCMDDLLEFAINQPRDQWKFWTSLAYQLCGQVCP